MTSRLDKFLNVELFGRGWSVSEVENVADQLSPLQIPQCSAMLPDVYMDYVDCSARDRVSTRRNFDARFKLQST
jgi:hypothetical protein